MKIFPGWELSGWEIFGWEFSGWELSGWEFSWVGIVQVGLILGGNFLWWKFSGWELSGGNHPGGSFHVTVISPDLTRHWATCKRGLYVKSYCFFQAIAQRFKKYKLFQKLFMKVKPLSQMVYNQCGQATDNNDMFCLLNLLSLLLHLSFLNPKISFFIGKMDGVGGEGGRGSERDVAQEYSRKQT